MGRKPSENPKFVHLGVRVDEDMVKAIDAEIADIQRERPGLSISRSEIVRMWIREAVAKRDKKK